MQNSANLNQNPAAGNPDGCRRKVLLLVDDSHYSRALYGTALRGAGFHVVEVCSGWEAQRATEETGHFDLLVTDYLMPGMSGGRLADWFHRQRPRTGVLIYSSSPECVQRAARNLPFADCMAASPNIAEFVACVRTVLDQHACPLPVSGLS